MDLFQRTLQVSLQTGDITAKSDLQSYLSKSNNAQLFIAVILDDAAEISGRVLAITILCEGMHRDKFFDWYQAASETVSKLALHENPEIAATAAKYVKDEQILTEALDHKSPDVRRAAAKRLRQLITAAPFKPMGHDRRSLGLNSAL